MIMVVKFLGTVQEKTFTVTNSGGVSAASASGSGLSLPFKFKGGSYPGTGGTCGTTIVVGTCTVVVEYNPTVTGSHSDTFNLDYYDGATNQTAT